MWASKTHDLELRKRKDNAVESISVDFVGLINTINIDLSNGMDGWMDVEEKLGALMVLVMVVLVLLHKDKEFFVFSHSALIHLFASSLTSLIIHRQPFHVFIQTLGCFCINNTNRYRCLSSFCEDSLVPYLRFISRIVCFHLV